MLPPPLLRFRRLIIIAIHLVLIPVGYLAAFALRFDLPLPERYLSLWLTTLPFLVPIRFGALAAFGMHLGWWRHVGMRDLVDLVKAITVSSAILLAVLFLNGQLEGMPRSVLVLDWLMAVVLLGGVRFLVRGAREARSGWTGVERRGMRTLVIGAGEGGERLIRQVRQGGAGIRPIGLVDDDPLKRGMRLHGISVIGTIADLPRLVERHRPEFLTIAIPSASREEMRRIVECCMATGIEFKIVPPLAELLDGRARVSQLRTVQVEDLLGRDAVDLDAGTVRANLEGKVVLVSGGAGSIGSELARQIARFQPGRLILLDQAESPLYFIDIEIRKLHPHSDIVPVVADVTDRGRLERVFSAYRPDYVFHAAAYKHVPLMEVNATEAVRNNAFGTLNVAECAAEHGAAKFVLISTDKAVRPSSIMGATKRVAERIVLGWPSLRNSDTDFRAVRFGNVLGSDGSVVPVFRRQLAAGGPLTVTHPDVTRYFMTIPEAVQLVLQAAVLPEAAGRISMLEMGEPVRIVDLAENLIRLSGLEPHKDVSIVFSGLRPGEKLCEELMSEVEVTVPTTVDKIQVVQTDEIDAAAVEQGLDRLATAVEVGAHQDLVNAICALVPECVPPLREAWVRSTGERTPR